MVKDGRESERNKYACQWHTKWTIVSTTNFDCKREVERAIAEEKQQLSFGSSWRYGDYHGDP